VKLILNVCEICGVELHDYQGVAAKVTVDIGQSRKLWNTDCCPTCRYKLDVAVSGIVKEGQEAKQARRNNRNL
jgi:hypothetical protein